MLVAYADGVDAPVLSPEGAVAAAGLRDGPVEVLVGWLPSAPPWIGTATGRATMAGYGVAGAVAEGRIRYLPVRLSAVPRLLADLRPDVGVVTGVRRGDGVAFAATVGIGPSLVRSCRAVVVEVDPAGRDLGGPAIEGPVAAVVERPPGGPVPPVPRPPEDVDLAIGTRVAGLLPDGATIQLGPGGIAEAVLAGVDRPVSIWSGLVTEAAAGLAGRGLLHGVATTAYTWGGAAVAELAAAGRLRLVGVEATHDPSRLGAIERFVACNTAIEVGLDGSVNVERVGGRQVAGIGGHADFAAGARRSPGGLSVVALRSTTRRGGSTVVPRVEVVSTPRCDVDVVVTEHGVADLRGLDDGERAARLVAVAAPEHRPGLSGAASV